LRQKGEGRRHRNQHRVATGSDAFILNSGSDQQSVAIHYAGQASAHVWHSHYAEIPQ
jgi:hypothetical protein